MRIYYLKVAYFVSQVLYFLPKKIVYLVSNVAYFVSNVAYFVSKVAYFAFRLSAPCEACDILQPRQLLTDHVNKNDQTRG